MALEEADLEEVAGDSASEEVLHHGPLWDWVGEDCRDAAISSAELRECLYRQVILPIMLCLMEAIPMLEVCPMAEHRGEQILMPAACHTRAMVEHLWEQALMLGVSHMVERLWEQTPMLRR